MPSDSSTARLPRARPWWRWTLTALCALGLALSGYLSWHYLRGGSMIGCGGGSPCDDVLNSRWSTIAGVLPVSGLAASAYLAMLVCSASIGAANSAPVRRLAWRVLLVLAGAAGGSAIWFTIVQKWMIGAFCPYCMATHLTGLLLAGLVLWRATRASEDATNAPPVAGGADPDRPYRGPLQPSTQKSEPAAVRLPPPADRVSPSGPRALWSFILGVALAAILAVSQIGLTPATTYRGGDTPNSLTTVDSHSVPLVGSPDARFVVTLLFDYKCPHCQQLHVMLAEAIRLYGSKLAFALRPAPLNRACNPYVPRDVDEFKDSCALAKIALAVWRADRAAFPTFDDWMYSFDSGDRWQPRTLDAATAKAIELVGRAKFEAAANDPWIERYLQTSVHLYGATMQNGTGGVPKLVYGSRWVTPQPATPADLVSILQTSLRVHKP